MVTLTQVEESNAQVSTSLPGMVAVFVGATNGIGETTLRQFAKYARRPRVYFVGRSQEAGDRIAADCKKSNREGEFIFIKADCGLIRNVDDVCREIKSKEKSINLLVLSIGILVHGIETSEGLHLAAALVQHSRIRFILNFLPLLESASSLRRVVSIFTGTKEGSITLDDIQGRRDIPLMKQRGHASSLHTLSLEILSQRSPSVTFIHDFPSFVRTGIARGMKGMAFTVMQVVMKIIAPFTFVPIVECGERHVFCSTSAKYPPRSSSSSEGKSDISGVPLPSTLSTANGTDGTPGSGVYSIDWDGEIPFNPQTAELLAKYRREGVDKKVWDKTMEELVRITGRESI